MPIELNIPTQFPLPTHKPRKIAIVVSRYNDHITNKLLEGSVKTLTEAGIPDDHIMVIRVPGAWELVFGSQTAMSDSDCRAVVALGAVIRGETSHDQHINRAVSMALMQLSIEHKKPVGLGLLTVNSLEQAIQRSGGNFGNKGEEAASAIIECLKIADQFSESTRDQP